MTALACLIALWLSAAAPAAAHGAATVRHPPLALPGGPALPGTTARRRPGSRELPGTLAGVLSAWPADSLARPLRAFELEHGHEPAGADAAFLLGQLHYARGEYRQASESFARAAARYAPARKAEARYWQGLSALGMHDAPQARSALEELAASGSPRASEARFGVALAWLQAARPDRAMEILEPLAAGSESEITPAALEQVATLATGREDASTARHAIERLRREYPQSIEAMRLPEPPPTPKPVEGTPAPARGGGLVGVQIGAFAEGARARVLVEEAKRAGFTKTELTTQGQGEARLYTVRIGWFANEAQARAAGERASQALGVAYRLVRNP